MGLGTHLTNGTLVGRPGCYSPVGYVKPRVRKFLLWLEHSSLNPSIPFLSLSLKMCIPRVILT